MLISPFTQTLIRHHEEFYVKAEQEKGLRGQLKSKLVGKVMGLTISLLLHAEAVCRAIYVCFLQIKEIFFTSTEKLLDMQKQHCSGAYKESLKSFFSLFHPKIIQTPRKEPAKDPSVSTPKKVYLTAEEPPSPTYSLPSEASFGDKSASSDDESARPLRFPTPIKESEFSSDGILITPPSASSYEKVKTNPPSKSSSGRTDEEFEMLSKEIDDLLAPEKKEEESENSLTPTSLSSGHVFHSDTPSPTTSYYLEQSSVINLSEISGDESAPPQNTALNEDKSENSLTPNSLSSNSVFSPFATPKQSPDNTPNGTPDTSPRENGKETTEADANELHDSGVIVKTPSSESDFELVSPPSTD